MNQKYKTRYNRKGSDHGIKTKNNESLSISKYLPLFLTGELVSPADITTWGRIDYRFDVDAYST